MLFVRGSAALHSSPLCQSNTPTLFTSADNASSIFDFTDEFVDAIEDEDICSRRGSTDSNMAGSTTSESMSSSSIDSDTDSEDDCYDDGDGVNSFSRGAGALLDQLEAVIGQGKKARPISQSSSFSCATAVPNSPYLARTVFTSPAPPALSFTPSNCPTPVSYGTSARSSPSFRSGSSKFSFTETDIADIDIEDLLSVFDEWETDASVLASMLRLAASPPTPKPRQARQSRHTAPVIAPRAPPRRVSVASDLPYADLFPTTTTASAFPGRKASVISIKPQTSSPFPAPPHANNTFTNPFPSSARPAPSFPFPSTTATPFSHQSRASVTSTFSASSGRSSVADSFRWSLSSTSSAATTAPDDSPPCSRRVSTSSTNSFGSRKKNATEQLNYEDFLHELASDDIMEEGDDEVAELPRPTKTAEPSYTARKPSLITIKGVRNGLQSIVIPAPVRTTSLVGSS